EAFTQWPNFKLFLVSLLGATAGQGVVWYTGQYYALFYLQSILRVNPRTGFVIVALAMLFGMPFFTVFGALSDKIGRKKIIMAGCLLAVVTYYPIYHAMQTDRKSTRLNSSHVSISYAVFCLKKKNLY